VKAFFTLRDKAHAMLIDGRSRQLIVAQLLADPCFGKFLEENRLTQDLTVSQKVNLANTLLVAAIAKELQP